VVISTGILASGGKEWITDGMRRAVGPREVIQECNVGAIEARLGPLKSVKTGEPARPLGNIAEPRNFEEFIYKVWAGIAKHFTIPYNRKLWAVPLHEMETSWLGGRVPLPDLKEMIKGSLSPAPKTNGTQRPLWISAAWWISGADGWLVGALERRTPAEHSCGGDIAPGTHAEIEARGAPSITNR